MVKINSGMVEIPAITLNSLKGLLFSNNGVDISPIVNDLSIGMDQAHKDLMEIHVALVMKGIKPQINVPKVVLSDAYRGLEVHLYKGFSLIEGVCAFDTFHIDFNIEHGVEANECDVKWSIRNKSTSVFGPAQLEQMFDSETEAVTAIAGLHEDEKELVCTEQAINNLVCLVKQCQDLAEEK